MKILKTHTNEDAPETPISPSAREIRTARDSNPAVVVVEVDGEHEPLDSPCDDGRSSRPGSHRRILVPTRPEDCREIRYV